MSGVPPPGTGRDLEEIRRLLGSFVNYERTGGPRARTDLDLGRMARLVAALDHPERTWPSIHVAGTKGKGSTATLAASVLRAAGLRVGLYVSPHVTSELERIQVDGREVAAGEMRALLEDLGPLLGEEVGRRPTYFEVLTAAAFEHFRRRRVEIAVIEVGMGGRLDSTNVVRPEAAVVTNVSLDHVEVLGPTVEAIAAEKAGILKEEVPAVTGAGGGALAVVEEAARRLRSALERLGSEILVTDVRPAEASLEVAFGLETPRGAKGGLRVGLGGRHQARNAALAVAAVEIAAGRLGIPLGREAVARGLAGASLPGRMEIVARAPAVLLDGAHNAASARALAEALGDHFPGARWTALFGCARDKDARRMIEALAPALARVVLSPIPSPRSADPEALLGLAREAGLEGSAAPDPEAGLREARAAGGPVLVTGSFYLVGEARRLLAEGRSPASDRG